MKDDNHVIIDPDVPTPTPPEPTPVPPVPPGPTPVPTPVTPIDPEKVKRIIVILNKMATSLKQVIPGDLDDQIIDFVESIDQEDWFVDVVVMLLELRKKDPATYKDTLKNITAMLKASMQLV